MLLENRRQVDIGGRCLALVEIGQGSPVVILETGLMLGAEGWETVQRRVAQTTRVVRYDRAGRGQSDPGPLPRTAGRMQADLHALLEMDALPGPYILVGQSFGGIVVRLFAANYPGQIAGLVLVDPTHEDQFGLIASALPPAEPQESPTLASFRRFWGEDYREPANNQENIDFPASFAEVKAAEVHLDVPLVILSSGNLHPGLDGHPAAAQRCREIWWELHEQLTALSSDARHALVPDSGHFIQQDQPDVVAAAVLEVVDKYRLHADQSEGKAR